MTDATPPPFWIDVSGVDDPRDVVHRAVACLAQAGIVGAATESVYGLTACALEPASVARMLALRGDRSTLPPILLLKGPDEVVDWLPSISAAGRRMTRRLWPGPTVFVSDAWEGSLAGRLSREVRDAIAPTGAVALACPASPMMRDIMRLLPSPLIFATFSPPGEPEAITAECFRGHDQIDMVLDTGHTRYRRPPTFVRVDDQGWAIEREGVVDAATVGESARLIILFVCTGNTCRSPMAEGICKIILARRLRCEVNELEKRGYMIRSAGVATSGGDPAAAHAIEILRGLGGSLESHRSRRLDAHLARQADHIFAMTADHLEGVLNIVPDAEPRAFLLDPAQGDVSDPFGSDRESYKRTAGLIHAMLEQRLSELGL